MNKEFVLYNFKEALEQLQEIVDELETDPEYNPGGLFIQMQHLYQHINTAWNAQDETEEATNECSGTNYNKWRQFPKDLPLEI